MNTLLSPQILITGATGAIGSALLTELYARVQPEQISVLIRPSGKARKLLARFPGISAQMGSVNDEQCLAKVCAGKDVIFHLAGIIPPQFDKNPELGFRSNVEGTRSMVRAIQQHAPNAHLFFASSVAVYGDRLKTPMISVNDELPEYIPSNYAMSKIAAEEIIRSSGIRWTIFRLSAIMGIGNHKISGIIFHVPLETPLEIATVKDTARAFALAPGHLDTLQGRVFNLAGGEPCRITYEGFMSRAFSHFGLGKVDFPEYSFARANFHCGYFSDSDELEHILRFRSDDLDSYFQEFGASVPAWMRIATRMVRKPVKMYLTSLSEPLRAHRTQNKEAIAHFFGDEYPA